MPDPNNRLDDGFLPALYPDEFEKDLDAPRNRRIPLAIVGGVLFVGLIFGAFAAGKYFSSTGTTTQIIGTSGSNKTLGEMTESQLRDFITSNKLVAYWTGPIDGYKYSFDSPTPGVSVVRYLPNGKGLNDTAPNYRVIGTYIQSDATQAVITSGKKEGSVGFTNTDGNAVFYVRARPTNVYVAVKDKGVQVEIFDPTPDQSLALALFKGQIQQIR